MHRLILLVAIVTACSGRSSYTVTASTTTSASPDLVYVRPGVYAVANADAPVFYADNYYWLYADGSWYRSSHVRSGWTYAPAPYSLRVIERPRAHVRYSRYRPERRVHIDVRDRARARDHRDRPRVIERDYRARDRRDRRDRR